MSLAPGGPLDGRVDGYSATLIATVDACMNPNSARRPRSVDVVRDLLGIVVLGPLVGAVTLREGVTPVDFDLDIDATIMAAARTGTDGRHR
jgi:hypothetical protein